MAMLCRTGTFSFGRCKENSSQTRIIRQRSTTSIRRGTLPVSRPSNRQRRRLSLGSRRHAGSIRENAAKRRSGRRVEENLRSSRRTGENYRQHSCGPGGTEEKRTSRIRHWKCKCTGSQVPKPKPLRKPAGSSEQFAQAGIKRAEEQIQQETQRQTQEALQICVKQRFFGSLPENAFSKRKRNRFPNEGTIRDISGMAIQRIDRRNHSTRRIKIRRRSPRM